MDLVSQANGFSESGVKQIEGQVRTVKHALETRLQKKVPVESPLFAWMVEYSADVICKHRVGVDGKTPL